MDYKFLERCLACDGKKLEKYLDLGDQPLANSFHKKEDKLESYPLAVNLCLDCFHTQLTVGVNPEQLFRNYLYVSGTTKTLTQYFQDFVKMVEGKFGGKKLNVLEIASNDGTLLEQFKLRGHVVQGVDPARNLMPLSAAKGVPTLPEFWGVDVAKSLGKKYDVIIAMNVFAHIQSPYSFLEAFREVLSEDGILYIQTSQAEMFRRFEFDTIYHEHHSFFTMKSFGTLAQRGKLKVLGVQKMPVHGTSYLFALGFDHMPSDGTAETILAEEERDGFYRRETYLGFAEGARNVAAEVNRRVAEYRAAGYRIVGYGAAAKGNTFLNFARLDLDYIIDDSPMKVGLLSPGRDIEVVPMSILNDIKEKLLLVVLAWNFFEEITQRTRSVRARPGDISLTYFPQVTEKPILAGT